MPPSSYLASSPFIAEAGVAAHPKIEDDVSVVSFSWLPLPHCTPALVFLRPGARQCINQTEIGAKTGQQCSTPDRPPLSLSSSPSPRSRPGIYIYICIRRIEIPGRGIFGVRDHNAPL